MISRSGVVISITNCYIRFTLLTYLLTLLTYFGVVICVTFCTEYRTFRYC